MSRDKVHQPYLTAEGVKVPSVTQLLGNHLGWSGHALLAWTRAKMNQGIDPIRLRDHAAEIGTVAHGLIEQELTGEVFNIYEYPATAITIANVAFDAFQAFQLGHELETEYCEIPIVHEDLMYGGTIDWIGFMNHEKCIIDFKTSNNVYASHYIQACAYRKLVIHKYDEELPVYILHLNKDTGGYQLHAVGSVDKYWQVFKHCLALDKLKKELNT